jgi:DNA-binding GntR family transcriptional regulator
MSDASYPLPLESEQSTTRHIRQILLDRILGGVLKPGDRINENQLASEFAVSRGPIREALRSLEQAQLVEILHNKGVFVRKLNIEEALHLYDVRAALAYVAGKLLARRASSEQIQQLHALYEDMETARQAKDAKRYAELNEVFHAHLMRFTGNPRLIDWAQSIDRELRMFLRGGVPGPSRLRISNEQQHRAIIDAIEAGDAQGAALAFEEHVSSGKVRALDSIIVMSGAASLHQQDGDAASAVADARVEKRQKNVGDKRAKHRQRAKEQDE